MEFLKFRFSQLMKLLKNAEQSFRRFFFLKTNIMIKNKPSKTNACLNIFGILNFNCVILFPTIVQKDCFHKLLCYNTDILRYYQLSYCLVLCQRLVFISHFILISRKTLARVLCFYGSHIIHSKLCKNLHVTDFLCDFPNLVLNLRKTCSFISLPSL